MHLNIVGHTDSDGNDDANMKLSKARADAVKEALVSIYKISGNRLQTEGKGESDPVEQEAQERPTQLTTGRRSERADQEESAIRASAESLQQQPENQN